MFTVNGGVVENVLGVQVEILSHKFHNPDTDIVCCYIPDANGVITEVTYYETLDKKRKGSEVYKFRGGNKQHYWSRNFEGDSVCSTKYNTIAYKLRECFRAIDFNKYPVRPGSVKAATENNSETTVMVEKVSIGKDIIYFDFKVMGIAASNIISKIKAFNEEYSFKVTKISETEYSVKKADIMDLRVATDRGVRVLSKVDITEIKEPRVRAVYEKIIQTVK